MNGTIPIAFKFTPLAKVRLHRVKVFLSENVEYYCRGKKVHRMEPQRKLLLFEEQAQKSGEVPTQRGLVIRQPSYLGPSTSTSSSSGIGISGARSIPSVLRPGGLTRFQNRPAPARRNTNLDDPSNHSLLGNLEGGDASGLNTEFEVDIPLPGCQATRTPIDPKYPNSGSVAVKFHHGTIWENINVHHWIKIVLRISKSDESAPNKKRRHFEISIDSPIHLLSVISLFD